MSGSNVSYTFVVPLPHNFPTDDVVPIKLDLVPYWMPKSFRDVGVFIGSAALEDSETALGFVYMPSVPEKEAFFCTPYYSDLGELSHFALSDLKINENSEKATLTPF